MEDAEDLVERVAVGRIAGVRRVDDGGEALLGGSSTEMATTSGRGTMTSCTSLSANLKAPVEHVGLDALDLPALAGLGHDQPYVLARAREHPRRRGLDAEQARHPRRGDLQQPHERLGRPAPGARSGTRAPWRAAPPSARAMRLRHELAERDAQVREDQERDRVGERRREPRVEVVGRGAARPMAPMAIEKTVIADLRRCDEADRRVHQRQRALRAPTTGVGAFLQARTARCHERVLGGDEDRVAQTSNPIRLTVEVAHAPLSGARGLGGWSSSNGDLFEYRHRLGRDPVRTYVL